MEILWFDDDFDSFIYDFENTFVEMGKLSIHITKAVTPAQTIDKILEKAKTNTKFDLIILDIMMSHHAKININGNVFDTNHGYEAGKVFYTNFLKINDNTKSLPIIIYTNIEDDRSFDNWVKDEQEISKNISSVKKSEGSIKLISVINNILNKK